MNNASIKIRPLKTIQEYHTCEELQKAVWQFQDRDVIPINELVNIQKNGGVVMGAFVKNKMIGFVFGFTGIKNKALIHNSRMVAVLPQYRNSSIAYRLKIAQCNFVRKQGIKLMTWTFDPLQSINAYFNIRKLGVIVREYYVNLYGMHKSLLNKGLETDRFLAEWNINKKLTSSRANKFTSNIDEKLVVNQTYYNKKGLLVCGKPKLNLKDKKLFVEIPSDIMSLKKADIKLASDWRLKTRAIFTSYFRKGYIINDFASQKEGDGKRHSFYELSR
jgi:predicted GNAT superfamily acetyltransferase